MIDEKPHHPLSVIKEAWYRTHGMKLSFWGAVSLLTLITIGGTSLLGLLIYYGQATEFAHAHPLQFSIQHAFFSIPAGMLIIFLIYHVAQTLFQSIVLLPMFMGIRLIGLRRVVDKPVSATFTLKFFTWRYILRFVMLEIWVLLFIGIPIALAIFFLCAPHTYVLSHTMAIISYVISALFFLLVLFLVVSYAFINLIVIDRHLTAWEAMELSRKTIGRHWFCVLGALLWIFLVLIVGALLLGIGLIWAVPYGQCVLAIMYRQMLGVQGQDPVTQCELAHQHVIQPTE